MKYNLGFETVVKTYYTVEVDCDNTDDIDAALDTLEYADNIDEVVAHLNNSQGVTVVESIENLQESDGCEFDGSWSVEEE